MLYAAHAEEWEHATYLYPDAIDVLTALRTRGLKIGVLSNTAGTRARHEQIFARDGVDRLLDGAVYTSELPWTKPHPEAFRAAMTAIGVAARWSTPGAPPDTHESWIERYRGAPDTPISAIHLRRRGPPRQARKRS